MRRISFSIIVAILLCGLAYTRETPPKRVQLTPGQIRYYQQINDEIEALPEVKAKRAQQAAFVAGVASASGFTSWKLTAEEKGVFVEEVAANTK